MNTNKKIARIAGILFITATVAAILGGVFIGPILEDPDFLINISANDTQVLIGVLFELIAAGAVAGIGITMFPIFKKHNEALALGYAGGRIIEGVFIIISAIGALLLLTLGREYVAGAPGASHFQSLGALLLAERGWNLLIGTNIIFSLNALILNYIFYQSNFVPRFLSVWGLIGAPLILAAGLLITFDLVSGSSAIVILLVIPIALNEMVLAVWLIIKGFNSSAISSASLKIDMNREK